MRRKRRRETSCRRQFPPPAKIAAVLVIRFVVERANAFEALASRFQLGERVPAGYAEAARRFAGIVWRTFVAVAVPRTDDVTREEGLVLKAGHKLRVGDKTGLIEGLQETEFAFAHRRSLHSKKRRRKRSIDKGTPGGPHRGASPCRWSS